MQKFLIPTCTLVLIASGMIIAWVYFSAEPLEKSDTVRTAILVDLAKTFAQLAVIGVIGAFIKWLLDNHDQTKRARDTTMGLRKDVWRDLRGVYGEVEKARSLIEGAKSALTYGNQLRHIMDLRSLLGEIRHEVAISRDTFSNQDAVKNYVKGMEKYLDRLIEEYEGKYLALSLQQSQYEAEMKAGVKLTVDMARELDKLLVLKDFRVAAVEKKGEFEGGYHEQFRVNYFDARQAVLKDILR